MIDVVVPTITGREASLKRLRDSLEQHTPEHDLNWIVIQDSPTCGDGWKAGLELSEAPYVLLACDDQECVSFGWAHACIEAVDRKLLPCPRVWLPDGTLESNGGDMNAFEHIIARRQKDWTPVDYTTIPFLSREQADAIGMLRVHYASDVWVSYRGRQLGYETVLRHGYDMVHHHEQVGRGAGMSQSERDALDVATMRREIERCEYSSLAHSGR